MLPTDPAAVELLTEGRIDVAGRLVDASNATLYCTITHNGVEAECVYKPVRGERPLWDFPDGTLAGREVASYLVCRALGWSIVPPTVLRAGPFGPGMVQLWVETSPDHDLVDVVATEDVPQGWRRVLRARDRYGDPALLVHADHPELRRMAALDVVLNNADRKGGHVLLGPDGAVYGVDHGICLHHEDKLRTVLWGWLGEPLPADVVAAVEGLLDALRTGTLADELAPHITRKERAALTDRAHRLLDAGRFPAPGTDYPAIPWPAF
ncbi:MAG TPA: SCO1664 family protein [Pseudonocardiaceae bacterium]